MRVSIRQLRRIIREAAEDIAPPLPAEQMPDQPEDYVDLRARMEAEGKTPEEINAVISMLQRMGISLL